MRMIVEKLNVIWLMALVMVLAGCGNADADLDSHGAGVGTIEAEPAKGPHGGRLLIDDDFILELAIFETGVLFDRCYLWKNIKCLCGCRGDVNVRHLCWAAGTSAP